MTTRLFVYILFFTFVPVTVTTTVAQESLQDIGLLKAVFIYNFAKFTRWPESQLSSLDNQINLCAIGEDYFSNNLQVLDGKILRGRTINIEHFKAKTNDLQRCNVLYLAHSIKQETEQILELLTSKSVLTISEIPDFSKSGGMIELQTHSDKVRFTINLMATRKAGLEISARLLNLATVVEEDVLQ
ncbi:MAG: YfiR family protein [Candidatus Thiodiazotropha sp. LLP2]